MTTKSELLFKFKTTNSLFERLFYALSLLDDEHLKRIKNSDKDYVIFNIDIDNKVEPVKIRLSKKDKNFDYNTYNGYDFSEKNNNRLLDYIREVEYKRLKDMIKGEPLQY